jgi:acetoin utilization deacetylase AcuC-like enzyme
MGHLKAEGLLDKMTSLEARDATVEDARLAHEQALIERISAPVPGDHGWIDVDTYVTPRSYAAALRSAGGVLAATDAVLERGLSSAFCFVRPPGHHATPDKAMGFCLLNNVAITALHALDRRGLQRVAIVDFDVHHGNGTQDVFCRDPRVLYFSVHQFPFYPGTGNWDEIGEAPARGNVINVPFPRGCGDEAHLAAIRDVCVPAMEHFAPNLILVSAGFDAHFADPLAGQLVTVRGYYEIASALQRAAERLCDGRIVYALEGGYDLEAISWSAQACVDALLGNDFSQDPLGLGPEVRGPEVSGLLSRIKELHGL